MPDLERRKLSTTESEGVRRAGYSVAGSPSNLSVSRTMRNSISRRIALKRPRPDDLREAEEALAAAEKRKAPAAEITALRSTLEVLRRKTKTIAWIDPIDIRYRRFEPVPRPTTQAVMFCLMDVSASMSEHMKDLAKRFFMLLYVFLKKRYKKVDIVFIRHTDEASEVDEDTFFHGVESGGTRVSSAQREMLRVARDRYPQDSWNLYVAQASDGDNDPRDNAESAALLLNEIIPMTQYYAYLEVGEQGQRPGASTLWRAYQELGEPRLAQRSVTSREEIYPIFRELFSRDAGVRGSST